MGFTGAHDFMRRASLSLLVVARLLLATFTQSSPSIAWEPFTFAGPSGVSVEAERGFLEVPERHGDPRSPKIRLPLVRLRGTTPGRQTPLLWLEGGPGGSGIRTITGSYSILRELRAFGDIIAFDQRGTGSSEPNMAISGRFELPASVSVDSEAARDRLASIAQRIRGESRSRGIDLGAYNTRESADDVDAVRQALSVDKVVLIAHSYGTHLGLAVIKRYGEHVDRAILLGVNGLDQRWREPAAGDQWLQTVSDAVAKNQGAARSESLVDQVRRVLAQFERAPMVVTLNNEKVIIGRSEIQLYVVLRSGDLGFVRDLPVLFANLEKRAQMNQIAAAIQQATRQRPIGTAMTYAMHVSSGASASVRRQIALQAPTAIFGNSINWGIGDDTFVEALGVPDLGEDSGRAYV